MMIILTFLIALPARDGLGIHSFGFEAEHSGIGPGGYGYLIGMEKEPLPHEVEFRPAEGVEADAVEIYIVEDKGAVGCAAEQDVAWREIFHPHSGLMEAGHLSTECLKKFPHERMALGIA